jgi:hypothetical protein
VPTGINTAPVEVNDESELNVPVVNVPAAGVVPPITVLLIVPPVIVADGVVRDVR